MLPTSATGFTRPLCDGTCAVLHEANALIDPMTSEKRVAKLEPLDLRIWLVRIGWVICGGESGKNARYMEAGLGARYSQSVRIV